jgi:hypothetical protein
VGYQDTVFRGTECRRFACGSNNNDGIGAAFDVPFHQLVETGKINRPGFFHWGDDCN